MSKNTEVKAPEAKATEAKITKPKDNKVTVVSLITGVYKAGFVKDIETGTKAVMAKLKDLGQTHNVRGKEILDSKVSSLTRAFFRDIDNKRKGKWEKLEVVRDEKQGLNLIDRQ